MKIDELNLSTRACNTLLRAGINTVEKLKSFSDNELKHVLKSPTVLKEIEQATYCIDCRRSIWGENPSCDVNIENNGKYACVGSKCHCKVS